MSVFDPPEADWTDEYAWTRYRGPHPYPCPDDWVLDTPEGGGAMWYRYPDVGENHETDTDVCDAFEPDYEAYNDARGETAMLLSTIVDENLAEQTSTVEFELKIDGDSVFRRVEPDAEDLWGTAAEALSAYANSEDLDEVAPTSGRLPEDLQQAQDIEQRQSENRGLGEFDE